MLGRWLLAVSGELQEKKELHKSNSQYQELIEKIYESSDQILEGMAKTQAMVLDEAHKNIIQSLVTKYASYRILEQVVEDTPTMGCGQGIGSLVVLVCSGYMTIEEALDLLSICKLEQYDKESVMVKGMHCEIMNRLFKDKVCAVLSETSVLVEENLEQVKNTIPRWQSRGIQVTSFHKGGQVIRFESEYLHKLLQNVKDRTFKWPIWSMRTGKVVNSEEVESYLLDNEICLKDCRVNGEYLIEQQIFNMFVIGESEDFSMIMKENVNGMRTFVSNKENAMEEMKLLCGMHDYSFSGKCLGAAIRCENRNNNTEDYKENVIDNIKEFKKYSLKKERKKETFLEEDKEKCICFLRTVLEAKSILPSEQEKIIREIM